MQAIPAFRLRLIVMNFLEFYVWACWLISGGGYLMDTLHFNGAQVGTIYGTMGLASLITPAIMGIIADRWVNAERVLGFCHLAGAGFLLWASTATDYHTMYLAMLFNCMAYMPTIALNNTVSYVVLERQNMNVIKDFPPIRVWGTVGFIAAMWTVDLLGLTKSHQQLVVGAAAAVVMGLYSFTMPACPPARTGQQRSLAAALGLDAFVLFKVPKMLIFFIFAMLLGAALQITNTFGNPFLGDFSQTYPQSFAVLHPNVLLSISQVSETLFILTIPFFLRRLGIKGVMIMSIFAWVFRFGLFGIGNPGSGFIFLILSMIVYGMAFDFFNISGSLFIEKEADIRIRASAQGLFMLMTNGVGAYLGGFFSGRVVDHFSHFVGKNRVTDWSSSWFSFAAYALLLGIVFPLVFRYKHDLEDNTAKLPIR